ncbi:hypothetical protein BGZ70_009607 [Mortierella alpina]|uniref:Uncharacterized protein n=1 Tax=Mortierella alpina TaxID=64518 RepID=A0A9P6J146_MORAP|nr:hypothetical protein BGZ70_009607 [Mortierella alpina]
MDYSYASQPAWLPSALTSDLHSDNTSKKRSSGAATYPPRVQPPRGSLDLLQALSATATQDDIAAQAGMTTDDMKASCNVIYQHLHEKHYLDRLLHALYLRTGGYLDALENMETGSQNGIRFEPMLRFRICTMAHLLEAAFGLANGSWVEHLRVLTDDEHEYVMRRLQALFLELFEQPVAQAGLRRFLSALNDWITSDQREEGDEEQLPDLPAVVKEVFPCSETVLQKMLNIKGAALHDVAFKYEIQMLLKFLMLSFRDKSFASADDWITEGNTVIGNLQHSLQAGQYRGPVQRLIHATVNVADQMWEGGGATDTSLAIEKCLATVIQKFLEGRGAHASGADQAPDAGLRSGWDVMGDFERLVLAMSDNVAPIPLPAIVWKRKKSEVHLDSAIVEFPRFDPNCIRLNSSMEYSKQTNKLRRRWNLKISDVELKAKHVAYYFVSKSALLGPLVDAGMLSLSIPPSSLCVEMDFVLSPPGIQRRSVTALQESGEKLVQKHPIASAAHRALSSVPPPPTTMRRRSLSQASQSGRRLSQPSIDIESASQAAVRSGARLGQEIARNVTEDARSTFEAVVRILYPNRPQPFSQQLNHLEQRATTQVPSRDRMSLGRPQRRYTYGNGTQSLFTNRSETLDSVLPAGPSPAAPVSSGATAYYSALVEATEARNEVFMNVKTCRVHLRKIAVQVHETKHPLLQAAMHPILVRQLRKALEQTLKQAITELIGAINDGAEQVMSFTQEELQKRHGIVSRTTASQPQQLGQGQRQRQQRFVMPVRQPEPSKQGSDIIVAMPLFATL